MFQEERFKDLTIVSFLKDKDKRQIHNPISKRKDVSKIVSPWAVFLVPVHYGRSGIPFWRLIIDRITAAFLSCFFLLAAEQPENKLVTEIFLAFCHLGYKLLLGHRELIFRPGGKEREEPPGRLVPKRRKKKRLKTRFPNSVSINFLWIRELVNRL